MTNLEKDNSEKEQQTNNASSGKEKSEEEQFRKGTSGTGQF